jgi:hypothetical protein
MPTLDQITETKDAEPLLKMDMESRVEDIKHAISKLHIEWRTGNSNYRCSLGNHLLTQPMLH